MSSKPVILQLPGGGEQKGTTTKTDYHFRIKSEVRRDLAKLNISQNRLASKLGITTGYMSQLLGGTRYASPELRQRLLNILPGIDFDGLFEEVSR